MSDRFSGKVVERRDDATPRRYRDGSVRVLGIDSSGEEIALTRDLSPSEARAVWDLLDDEVGGRSR